MNRNPPRGTLLQLPLMQERYGSAFLASICVHLLLLSFVLFAPLLFPSRTPILLGTGPGGGSGGDSYTVGVADDLGGGAGLFKPALTPQPPALPVEKPAKKDTSQDLARAVPIPDAAKPKKSTAPAAAKASKAVEPAASKVIPVEGAQGAGGSGGRSGGSGGGAGGGTGVSIGSGSGGLVDSWYARVVEARVSQAWIKPVGIQQRIEIVYSFLVADTGRIYDIKLEKTSGNEALDLAARRAILASDPLLAPPPELRGRPLQFVCQFVYPPNL
ncbi:MAG: TonB terminal [Acidobacteria bacterium]|nr:TonB terminal [Acidobacteriota bacterium]